VHHVAVCLIRLSTNAAAPMAFDTRGVNVTHRAADPYLAKCTTAAQESLPYAAGAGAAWIVHAFERGGRHMKLHLRFAGMLTLALACAFTLGLRAQETRTETKIKGDDAKTVIYTGCVQPGSETQSFILAKAVPIRRTTVSEEPTGTSGVITTTTSTSYALVPSESVELQPHLGHKVEITGVMTTGDVKKETKTKTEGGETRTEERIKGDSAMPQFRVISVKELADSCS
jgi:hypothetical protein